MNARVAEPAHTANGQFRQGADLVAILQKAALSLKIRVVGRRDRIREAAVVGQRHMEAGDARPLQQRHKDRQLRLHHAGIAIMGIFLADGQFIINGRSGSRRRMALTASTANRARFSGFRRSSPYGNYRLWS